MTALQRDADSRGPIFFVSYAEPARAPRAVDSAGKDPSALRFFHDLSVHVDELVGSRVGADVGFMDRTLTGGSRWSAEILEAVRTAQVLIPLVSPSYVQSRWCGMEWDAFTRRRVMSTERSHATPIPILPVTWIPMHRGVREPAALRAVQRFVPGNLADPGISDRYARDGVYGLMVMRDDAYQAVVWRLAQWVARLHHTVAVEPGERLTPDQLRDVFVEES